MSSSALTEEELSLAEYKTAQIYAKLENDAFRHTKNVIYCLPIHTDFNDNGTNTGVLGLLGKGINSVVSNITSIMEPGATPFQYLCVTSQNINEENPGTIEIHTINVKYVNTPGGQILSMKINHTWSLNNLKKIILDTVTKTICTIQLNEDIIKLRTRTEEQLSICVFILDYLTKTYSKTTIELLNIDLTQLNVDATVHKYLYKCRLLADDDELSPMTPLEGEEEEMKEDNEETKQKQIHLNQDMNNLVIKILEDKQTNDIKQLSNEIDKQVKDKENIIVEHLISLEAGQNKDIVDLKSTLDTTSKAINSLQSYLSLHTVELMTMRTTLKSITSENEVVSIRKENQTKLYKTLDEMLNRLTVDDASKDILTRLDTHLKEAFDESAEYGHIALEEGLEVAESKRREKTGVEVGEMMELIEITDKLQDLVNLKNEVVNGVSVGDMNVVKSRCEEFKQLSDDYFLRLYKGIKDRISSLFNSSNTLTLQQKCESMIFMAPLFINIQGHNSSFFEDLKNDLINNITSSFRREAEEKANSILNNIIKVESSDKGRWQYLPNSSIGTHEFEQKDLQEKWKQEEIVVGTEYMCNIGLHKFVVFIISLIQRIQLFCSEVFNKKNKEGKLIVDTINFEAILSRIFNCVPELMKKFIENENVNPYMYITWIIEFEYLLSRKDIFSKDGSIMNTLKGIYQTIIDVYNHYWDGTLKFLSEYTVDIRHMGILGPIHVLPAVIDRYLYAYHLGSKRIVELEGIIDGYKQMGGKLQSVYIELCKQNNIEIKDYEKSKYVNGECLQLLTELCQTIHDRVILLSTTKPKYQDMLKVQNFYFMNRTLVPRHIQGINTIMKQCDNDYNASRVKYVQWVLSSSFPSYMKLYTTILKLLENKSIQDIPHYISRSQFTNTFTIKSPRKPIKKLHARVKKHIHEESGLLMPVWETITRTFEDYCREIQNWSTQGYNGARVTPSPEDLVQIMSSLQ
ncbi:hypothetical protein WA158_008144 [Blastocystis sp. Blastoise]